MIGGLADALVEILEELFLGLLLVEHFVGLGVDLVSLLTEAFPEEAGHELIEDAELVIGETFLGHDFLGE